MVGGEGEEEIRKRSGYGEERGAKDGRRRGRGRD